MTKRLTYTKAHILTALHDDLVAAGIHPSYVGDTPGDADGIELEVADSQDEAAVAAVVATHDREAAMAARQAARQAERDEDTQVRGMVAQLDEGIATIQGATPPSAAQLKAGVLLALRAVRLLVRHELRRRGS